MADAILDAASGRRDPRLARARQTARDFAWPVMARQYLATLDRLHARRLAHGAVAGLGVPAAARP
jgi:hypothetical protein